LSITAAAAAILAQHCSWNCHSNAVHHHKAVSIYAGRCLRHRWQQGAWRLSSLQLSQQLCLAKALFLQSCRFS
jgi:hypothetical protein